MISGGEDRSEVWNPQRIDRLMKWLQRQVRFSAADKNLETKVKALVISSGIVVDEFSLIELPAGNFRMSFLTPSGVPEMFQ